MAHRTKPALSGLENKVMRVIWRQGPATAYAVRAALGSAQPLADSTVRTILRRLEHKGYVAHTADGRTYVYSATVAPRSVAAEAVRGIIHLLCNGSVEDLLLGMVDREVVSPETLRELAGRIGTADKAGSATEKGKRRRAPHSSRG